MTAVAVDAGPRSSVLRNNRPFLLLWAGQALSGFGSSMTAVALPLVLLTAGHPVAAVAAVGTAAAVAGLTARLPAGLLADRRDQRGLLIVCDLIRFGAMALVALYAALWSLPLWLGFGAVVVSAAATEVFKPAQFRLVRQVVTTDQIPMAVSLNQARSYAAQMAGPAAAGALVMMRPAAPFTVDAVTFLASAACVAAIRPKPPAASAVGAADAAEQTAGRTGPASSPPPAKAGFWNQLTAGLRYVAHDRFLRRSTAFFSGLTLLFGTVDTALLLGVGREHDGAAVVGWAFSTAAAAGLLGSLAATRLQRRLRLPVLVATGPAVAAALLLTAGLTGRNLAFVAGFSAMCLLVPAINAAVVGVLAASVPEEVLGRVATANDFAVQLLQPCAPLVAGLLLAAGSLATTALVLAAGFAVLALAALTLPTPKPGPPRSAP